MKFGVLIIGFFAVFVVLSLSFFTFSSSAPEPIVAQSNSQKGFADFPQKPIAAEIAIDLAKPYLAASLEKRHSERESKEKSENLTPMMIWVSLKGDFYYVVQDDYSSYTPAFYLKHAVKVHADTGEVQWEANP